MASLYNRTETLDSLKTRRLIFQYPDGAYPIQSSVPIIADTQGTFGFSSVTIDVCGNVIIPGNLEVQGGSGIPVSEAVFIVGPNPTIIGSSSGAGVNPTILNLQPQGGQVVMGGSYAPPSTALLDVFGATNIRGPLTVTSSSVTLDASGNLTIAGGLTLGQPLFVPIRGQDVSGNISGKASSITGDISGSQVKGDISGGQIKGDISGRAASIIGDISGHKVQGDISGSAASIRGDISGSQVKGDIEGKAFTITSTIFGSQVIEDICGNSGGISLGCYVDGSQITGDISSNGVTVSAAVLRGNITDTGNTSVSGAVVYGQLAASVLLNGNQVQGDISGNQIAGRLTKADISGSQVRGDISGQQIVGALGRANITGQQVLGALNSSVTLDGSQLRGPQTIDGSLLFNRITFATIPGTSVTGIASIDGSKIGGTITTAQILGSGITGGIDGSIIKNSITVATIPGTGVLGPIAAGQITGLLTAADISGARVQGDISGNQITGSMPRAYLPSGNITGTIDGGTITGVINSATVQLDGTKLVNSVQASLVTGTLSDSCYIKGSNILPYIPASGISGELTYVRINGSLITDTIHTATIPLQNVRTAPATVLFDASGIAMTPENLPSGIYALCASPTLVDPQFSATAIYTTAYYGYSGFLTNVWFLSSVTGPTGAVLSATPNLSNIRISDTSLIKSVTISLLSSVDMSPT